MPGEEEGGFGGGQTTELPIELKKWADAIKATTEAIDALSGLLDAPRSVLLEVNNTTSNTLKLQGVGDHDWGVFGQGPPFEIPPNTTALFTSRSDRPLTGTQGNVQFHVDDAGTRFHIEWNNPFVGGAESLCRVEGTHADWYLSNYVTGGGNKAEMRYMIGEKARANPRTPPDWRYCVNCGTLVSGLDQGHCAGKPLGIDSAPTPGFIDLITVGGGSGGGPAPIPVEYFGKHEAAGFYFRLPFGFPGPNREADWRKCDHCKGLFFDGWDFKGVCPGRHGGHVAESGGPPIQLLHDVSAGASQQANWRFCDKCHTLFFLPHNDNLVCAAGGNHHAKWYSYVLDHEG